MPPRKSATLTEAELRLMDVLWHKGKATVQEVLASLPDKRPLAYNSVLTTIRILEKKGYVGHIKDGRAHVYTPIVERQDAIDLFLPGRGVANDNVRALQAMAEPRHGVTAVVKATEVMIAKP